MELLLKALLLPYFPYKGKVLVNLCVAYAAVQPMFFPLCGSEWIFYILIAAEVLTPLPEKNAGESLPLL